MRGKEEGPVTLEPGFGTFVGWELSGLVAKIKELGTIFVTYQRGQLAGDKAKELIGKIITDPLEEYYPHHRPE